MLDRKRDRNGFDRTCAAEDVPRDSFGRGDRGTGAAEHLRDRLGLCQVVELGGGPVGVYVTDVDRLRRTRLPSRAPCRRRHPHRRAPVR